MSLVRRQSYGVPIDDLLAEDRLMSLGHGTPNEAVREKLRQLSPKNVLGNAPIADRAMASCLISALWLYHDFLDESHTLSQDIDTPTGSFLHGIMHRREGDFGNAKYWFRRVVQHPAYEPLHVAVEEIFSEQKPGRATSPVASQSSWDPSRFVDAVEQTVGSGSAEERICQEIQQAEWWLLFDATYHSATGADRPVTELDGMK